MLQHLAGCLLHFGRAHLDLLNRRFLLAPRHERARVSHAEAAAAARAPPAAEHPLHQKWVRTRDIWQLDLPSGYRLEYTVVDADRVVLALFIGNHDDAAAYLRGKK